MTPANPAPISEVSCPAAAQVSPTAADTVAQDRHTSPWSTRQKIGRVLWWFVQATIWRWSWHSHYGWRRWVLRRFGATINPAARIRPSVRIECPWNIRIGANSVVGDFAILYALGTITIGDRVTISQYSHLCAGTHDFTKPDFPLLRLPITIEDDAWLATDTFVGPGVTVGKNTIVGARTSAFKDLQPRTVYGGNPAKPLRCLDAPASAKT